MPAVPGRPRRSTPERRYPPTRRITMALAPMGQGSSAHGVGRRRLWVPSRRTRGGFTRYMHGNVWQWCSSLYKAYPYNPDDGREDETAPGDRVMRGGSYVHSPFNARSAKRYYRSPTDQLHDFGFRVVVSADMASAASAHEAAPQTNDQGEPAVPATAVGEAALPPELTRRVLLDMSHNFTFAESNGLCDPNAYLERKAYVVMDTEAGLREEVLKEFDVVVLFQQSADAQYTQKDTDLVKSLLERGGGVMMYADAGSCHGGLPLNRIAREFGVEFLPDAAQGPITGSPGYDGTISLSPRLLRIAAGVKYTPIARDKAGKPVIISMEWKKGRNIASAVRTCCPIPPIAPHAGTPQPFSDSSSGWHPHRLWTNRWMFRPGANIPDAN